MELNKNSFLNKYYHAVWQDYPESGCEYFSKLTLAILATPISLIGWPLWWLHKKMYNDEHASSIFFYGIILFKLAVIWFLAIYIIAFKQNPEISLWVISLMGYLSSFFICIIALLLAGGISFYKKPTQEKQQSEIIKITKERYKSFKENYCPKITWKD